MMLVLAHSMSHSPTNFGSTPGAASTFRMMWPCGLIQYHSATDPFSVTILSLSNIANEWCALTVPDATRMTTAAAKSRQMLNVIVTASLRADRSGLPIWGTGYSRSGTEGAHYKPFGSQ